MLFIRQLTIIVYAMMVVVVQTSLHGADDTITFIIIHTECTAGARWIFITHHNVLSKQMNYMQVTKCVWNGRTNAHSLAAGAPKESLYSLDKYSAIF